MNQFKALDSHFPCVPFRLSGEVVSVSITLTMDGWGLRGTADDTVISTKRKAWYVNASVNAFHMHRDLCREAGDLYRARGISSTNLRKVKKMIAAIVSHAYGINRFREEQYTDYHLDVCEAGTAFDGIGAFRTFEDESLWYEIESASTEEILRAYERDQRKLA